MLPSPFMFRPTFYAGVRIHAFWTLHGTSTFMPIVALYAPRDIHETSHIICNAEHSSASFALGPYKPYASACHGRHYMRRVAFMNG